MNGLTVGELIHMLGDIDPDLPVRFAHQPSYPFQLTIGRDIAVRTDAAGTRAAYLLEGAEGQVREAPYAPAGIFDGALEDDDEEQMCLRCGMPLSEGRTVRIPDPEVAGDQVIHRSCLRQGEEVQR